MISSLKRLSSIIICLVFYVFLFTSDFGGINNYCKADGNSGTTFIPLVNIKDSFNGHAIWWPNDDWDKYFDNNVPNNWGQAGTNSAGKSINECKNLSHGLDGYSAFYTSDPNRNNGVGGLPTDGKVTIGGVPFILQQNKDKNDCIRLNSTTSSINSISLSYLFENNTTTNKNLKFKNIYIMGVVAGPNAGSKFKIHGSYYNGSSTSNYTGTGNLYSYFSNISNLGNNSYTQDYYVRKCNANYWINNNQSDIQYRPNNTETDVPNIQCCKIDAQMNGQSTKIQTIGLDYTESTEDQFCCIFAITAEVETDLTESNVGCRNFDISLSTSDYYIEKFEAFKNPNFKDDQVENYMTNSNTTGIICTEEEPETTYYCRVTTRNTSNNDYNYYYSYITVTTLPANRLKLTALAPPRVYNGNWQQLITGIQIINTGTKYESKNEDVSTYDDYDKFKENIYLRIKDAGSYDTGWYNLNSLSSLTAMNAGIYYVYYFIDVGTDKLSEYDSEALSAELTQVTVSN